MRIVVFTLVVLMTSQLANSAEDSKDRAKSTPPNAVVQAKLLAKQDTYILDLGDKTGAEFQQQLKDGAGKGNYPMPPKIEVVLELTNTSDKDVQILVGGTRNVIRLDLQGPGAETVQYKGRATPRFMIAPKTITLAPGKSESVPITSLGFGLRNMTHGAYWTAPGEYTLRATYETAISPAPAGATDSGNGMGNVILATEPLKLKVVEKK